MTGPITPTENTLRSGFEEEIAEQLGHQNLQEYYESLLLSGREVASQVAQQQYQMGAESAAQQASYDISAAYANYLKQQRNVMSQGRLESGYKEELSGLLQEQYGSSYQQARATQTQNVATAAQQASKTYSEIYSDAESRAKTILEYYQKQATTKANLYKFIEEQAGYNTSTSPWYKTGGDGLELTPYGQEQIRRYLLENADAVTHGLEKAGLDDALAYYLSDPHGVRSELFGIEEDLYDYTSAQSVSARLSEQKTDAEIKTYQEAVYDKALEKFNQDDIVGIFDIYRTEYGLTDKEIKQALLPDVREDGLAGYTVENALNIALRRGDSKKANLQQVHDLLTQKAKTRK